MSPEPEVGPSDDDASAPRSPRAQRRTQASRRAETERRLVAAATEIIASDGWSRASMTTIGERAGYSRGIVHHHFGSREALLAAVLTHVRALPLPDREAAPSSRLEALVRTYLGGVRGRGARSNAFLVLWSESITNPGLRAAFVERDAEFGRYLEQILRDGAADGSFQSSADPSVVALTLIGLLRGLATQLLTSAVSVDADAAATAAMDLIQRGIGNNAA